MHATDQNVGRRGLSHRLALTFSCLIGVIVACAVLLNSITQIELVNERLQARSEHLRQLASELSMRFLIEGRPAELEVLFDDIGAQDDVVRIFLIDESGSMFAESGYEDDGGFLQVVDDPLAKEARQEGNLIERIVGHERHIAAPIILGGIEYGVLRIDLSKTIAEKEIFQVMRKNIIAGILFILTGLATSWMVARRMTRPLNQLTAATERAADGDLDQVIHVDTRDEFASLAASFNVMLAKLRESMRKTEVTAYRDKLVKFGNRAWISRQLPLQLETARDQNGELAVLFLDLDGFKEINDVHGHHEGDNLLAKFADRLLQTVINSGLNVYSIQDSFGRKADPFGKDVSIARRGGDEFTLVVAHTHAVALAQKIVASMKDPYETGNLSLSVTASIGIATFPQHADNVDDLIKCSDVAMYQAKAAGRNCWRLYDVDNHQDEIGRRELGSEIREGITKNQFVVFLQPQFNVLTGKVSGAEALLRWEHPTRGLVPPDNFLPIARTMGIMPDIGRLAFKQSIQIAREIQRTWSEPFTLAINVSVVELSRASYVDELVTHLEFAALPKKFIEIEITEETAMILSDDIGPRIEKLRETGVRLAIDDFGVGYSNLGRLKEMAFDTLKVDRSLTKGLGSDPGEEDLMLAIFNMASAMKAEVIAEGIETSAQLRFLEENACQFYQGYLGGKPMPVNDFMAFLEQQATVPRLAVG